MGLGEAYNVSRIPTQDVTMSSEAKTNKQVIEKLKEHLNLASGTELVQYLNEKYDTTISKQSLSQFENSTAVNITTILLHETVELLAKEIYRD